MKSESFLRVSAMRPLMCVLFSLLLVGIVNEVSKAEESRAATKRPNVIVILTDDQGWGDLSLNGNSNLATPTSIRLGSVVCASIAFMFAQFVHQRGLSF